jgi:hypothetical protein
MREESLMTRCDAVRARALAILGEGRVNFLLLACCIQEGDEMALSLAAT